MSRYSAFRDFDIVLFGALQKELIAELLRVYFIDIAVDQRGIDGLLEQRRRREAEGDRGAGGHDG